jgi:TonB family protein
MFHLPPMTRPTLRLLFLFPLFAASLLIGATADLDPNTTPGSFALPLKPIASPQPTLTKEGLEEGPITLGLWVDKQGEVTEVSVLHDNRAWHDAALTAARKWRFEPVRWNEGTIPARTILTFRMQGGFVLSDQEPVPNLPTETHTENEFGVKPPVMKLDPDLRMPLLALATRGKVEALVTYVIEPDGSTSEVKVPMANSEAAYRAVLDQVCNQRFTPATIKDEPVRYAYKQVVSTSSMDAPVVELEGLTEAMDPLYPLSLLLSGTGGTARLHFTLAPDGHVKSSSIEAAERPELGLALQAAVGCWRFSPECAAARPERTYEYNFDPDQASGTMKRLCAQLRRGESVSASPAGLDGKPKRLYSPAFLYPPAKAASHESGTAKIEFIIDANGLAQLPRILECSDPAFGWAAATWVGAMRFAPLRRNGLPAELRVIVPISFTPPADTTHEASTGSN